MADGAAGIVVKPGQEYLRARSSSPSKGASSSRRSVSSVQTDAQSELERRDPALRDDAVSFAFSDRSSTATATSLDGQPQQEALDDRQKSGYALAGSMAQESGKSLGKMVKHSLKGLLVDLPLATADGFRAMPQMWGEEVKDYGTVTDWQSGGMVAGKSLVQGIADGCKDVVQHPVRGAQEEGVLGAAKGVATGTGSFVSKTASAAFGIVAYPGQGIAKSLHSWTHGSTGKSIVEARLLEGRWRARQLSEAQRAAIVDAFLNFQPRDT